MIGVALILTLDILRRLPKCRKPPDRQQQQQQDEHQLLPASSLAPVGRVYRFGSQHRITECEVLYTYQAHCAFRPVRGPFKQSNPCRRELQIEGKDPNIPKKVTGVQKPSLAPASRPDSL